MNQEPDRYAGRPMLRFLDAYVLDAIGLLDDRAAANMVSLTPQIAGALGSKATRWQLVVAEALDLPADAPGHIGRLLASTQTDATARGVAVDPVEFAQFVADSLVSEGA